MAETLPDEEVINGLTAMSTTGELVAGGLANLHEGAKEQAAALLTQAQQAGAERPLVAAGYAPR